MERDGRTVTFWARHGRNRCGGSDDIPFEEVWDALGDWHPDFTNAEALKEKYGGTWEKTPAPQISGRSAKEAYAEMPEALRAYIKAMPEYDEELFRAITEEG